MNVFTIPDALAHHYKGVGIALATTDAAQVTSLVYLRDLDTAFDDQISSVPRAIENPKIGHVARALEKDFGYVRIGMVSCWEFCEL